MSLHYYYFSWVSPVSLLSHYPEDFEKPVNHNRFRSVIADLPQPLWNVVEKRSLDRSGDSL